MVNMKGRKPFWGTIYYSINQSLYIILLVLIHVVCSSRLLIIIIILWIFINFATMTRSHKASYFSHWEQDIVISWHQFTSFKWMLNEQLSSTKVSQSCSSRTFIGPGEEIPIRWTWKLGKKYRINSASLCVLPMLESWGQNKTPDHIPIKPLNAV